MQVAAASKNNFICRFVQHSDSTSYFFPSFGLQQHPKINFDIPLMILAMVQIMLEFIDSNIYLHCTICRDDTLMNIAYNQQLN